MPLPDFLIIGAMKSGTTSLYHYLSRHPEVFMPTQKELHYFVAERNWTRGLSWYKDMFSNAMPGQLVGEASPSYTAFPQFRGVPRRIEMLIPQARLLYFVRDPIERMKSHYQHEVNAGREKRPASVALTTRSSYFHRSCYARQLEQYLRHFACEQIHVIVSEDLRELRDKTMRGVFAFLDLPPVRTPHVDFNLAATKLNRRGLQVLGVTTRALGINRYVSPFIKQRVRSAFASSAPTARVQLTSAHADQLKRALSSDVRRLARLMPSEFHGWGLLSDESGTTAPST